MLTLWWREERRIKVPRSSNLPFPLVPFCLWYNQQSFRLMSRMVLCQLVKSGNLSGIKSTRYLVIRKQASRSDSHVNDSEKILLLILRYCELHHYKYRDQTKLLFRSVPIIQNINMYMSTFDITWNSPDSVFTFDHTMWTLVLFLFISSPTFSLPPQMNVLSLPGQRVVRQPTRNASPPLRDSSTSSSKSNRELKTWSPSTPMDPQRYRTHSHTRIPDTHAHNNKHKGHVKSGMVHIVPPAAW